MCNNTKVYNIIQCEFQDKLSSLLKTAENLKVKGLAEVIILTMIMIMIIMIMMIIVTIFMIIVNMIMIMLMIVMIIALTQVSGEEGKGGQASATPRLPGVSPIVPRIQGGQPPPMQVYRIIIRKINLKRLKTKISQRQKRRSALPDNSIQSKTNRTYLRCLADLSLGRPVPSASQRTRSPSTGT